ncbi:glycosyltransferase family 39 protein [Siculibacillus lacustris]|uniref:glycosyltransferase family 39 protein n=1 Tax=Siculibacillus lacustris TaxID=1549641 RepID=UPI0013F15C09|nr:glycosyltransferase family 39 protein [Siculibacillus lacustris]
MIVARLASAVSPRPVLLVGCAILCLACTVYYLWRIPIPIEVGYNEPWNAWHALRWAHGLTLYPDPADLIIQNYPPLSFVLIGSLARLGADPVLVGRILSLLAVPVVAAAAFSVVRDLGGSRPAAALAALWWCTALLAGFSTYVGMNDPSVLTVAIMAVGFALFVRADARGRTGSAGLAVMVVAGFFKHNVVTLPVTAVIWMATTRGRRAVPPIVLAVLAAAGGLILCRVIWGPSFVDQMTMPRDMSWARAFASLETPPWPAFALALVGLIPARRERPARLILILMATAVPVFLLQRSGEGVSKNAQLELVFAAAVGLGWASDRLVDRAGGSRRAGRLIALAFAAIFAKEAWSFAAGPFPLPLSSTFRADIAGRETVLAAEIERVRAMPATTVCWQMMVCVRAGQPFLYDPFGVHSFQVTGRWSRERIDAAVAARGLVFVDIDPRVAWPRR